MNMLLKSTFSSVTVPFYVVLVVMLCNLASIARVSNIVSGYLFQRHSISGSMSSAKPLSSLSDKRPSYTDMTMPGEPFVSVTI